MRRTVVGAVGAALLLAGCASAGTTSAGQSVTMAPADAVKAALASTRSAGSANFGMSMVIAVAGQTMSVKMSGPAELDGSKADMTMVMSGAVLGSSGITLRELIDGKTVYAKITGAGMPDQWFKLDLTKLPVSSGLSSLAAGSGLGDQLKQLDSLLDVKKVGTESVNGVETTHYSGAVDLSKVASLLSGLGAGVDLKSALASASIPVDEWVDASGHLVRMRERVSATVKGQSMVMSVQVDLSDFGVPVTVTPPAGAQDLTSLSGLSGLLGS